MVQSGCLTSWETIECCRALPLSSRQWPCCSAFLRYRHKIITKACVLLHLRWSGYVYWCQIYSWTSRVFLHGSSYYVLWLRLSCFSLTSVALRPFLASLCEHECLLTPWMTELPVPFKANLGIDVIALAGFKALHVQEFFQALCVEAFCVCNAQGLSSEWLLPWDLRWQITYRAVTTRFFDIWSATMSLCFIRFP